MYMKFRHIFKHQAMKQYNLDINYLLYIYVYVAEKKVSFAAFVWVFFGFFFLYAEFMFMNEF